MPYPHHEPLPERLHISREEQEVKFWSTTKESSGKGPEDRPALAL